MSVTPAEDAAASTSSGNMLPLQGLDDASCGGPTPFLKWPGGKRWLVADHPDIFPGVEGRYVEPFLGGGSVFFHLRPEKASLGDLNPDVVTAFTGVRDDPDGVEAGLIRHHQMHDAEYYYEVRNSQPRRLSNRAARVIYLNRTCFNGIYRVNRSGRFNVPVGSRRNVIFDTDDFQRAAHLLSGADIVHGDFEALIDDAGVGDMVFVDPPYTVRHNQNGFVLYNEKLFSWEDQERLASAVRRAVARGAKVIGTNACHDSVKQLYRGQDFELRTVSRFSGISASPSSRRTFEELLIVSK